MSKTEVYSWRLSPDLKAALEEAARDENVSIAELLERAVVEWLARVSSEKRRGEETREQRLRASALRFAGAIAGGDRSRARYARDRVRARLRKRHAP
jgi:hypothetical protein